MPPLAARIARDFTANGRKTALLAALTGVGLYFWLPPVWRAVRGSSASGPVAATPAAPSSDASGVAASAPAGFSWRTAERTRGSDALFASAERADLRADAFNLRTAFLPLDAQLVASEAGDPFPAPKAQAAVDPAPLPAPAPSFTLKSTVVGRGRKIALINGSPYAEGATVRAGGGEWKLLTVAVGRAVLTDGQRRVELKIDPFATSAASGGGPP